ncbi:hypothetical protein RRG08_058472 [Elysia crispata]|uniref:Uncharacterized protein n=1 Tax=Elysia crispata TaxID=231223 RepID=A0AAE0Y635_9GAST|nr:hypothetical protein RRG08_058472 [Elysia crispata]
MLNRNPLLVSESLQGSATFQDREPPSGHDSTVKCCWDRAQGPGLQVNSSIAQCLPTLRLMSKNVKRFSDTAVGFTRSSYTRMDDLLVSDCSLVRDEQTP